MRIFPRILLALIPLLVISCAPPQEQMEEAPPIDLVAEAAAVTGVVDAFSGVFMTEDMDLLSQVFAHDPDMVLFGTDEAERWVGWEEFRASVEIQFASYEHTEVSTRDQVIRVSSSGETAWFSEVIDMSLTAGGERVEVPGMRFTGVLEKRDGTWVIVQMHASVGVAGQVMEY